VALTDRTGGLIKIGRGISLSPMDKEKDMEGYNK
jgi:hypothetical protein